MQALDELLARWRKNPDQDATLALCAHLGTSRRSELLREVGNTAEAWHRDNHAVMLSVGRMYLDAGLLAEAQATFVQTGKLAPSDTEAYRYLGEVLLRRGDAVRGEKALARAIKLGDATPETKLWHERTIVYGALQTRKGLRAVADEVARTAPLQRSIPAPTLSPFDLDARPPARARRSRPPGAPARPSGPKRSAPPGAAKRRSVPASNELAPAKSAPLETLLMGRSPVPMPAVPPQVHPPSPFFPSDSLSPQAPAVPVTAQRAGARAPAGRKSPARPNGVEPLTAKAFFPHEAEAARPPASDPFKGTFEQDAPASQGGWAALKRPRAEPAREPVVEAPAPLFEEPAVALDEAENQFADAPEPASAASSAERSAVELPAFALASKDPMDGLNPSPETVLLALARVGLYETDSTVVPAWEASPPAPPRRHWLFGAALCLVAGAGFGAHRFAVKVQGERVAQAQELSMRLGALLDSGSTADLAASEALFQRLFELDSRSQEAAMLWLRNRAFGSIMGEQVPSGIESAAQRARTVGVEEVRLVFGRLASALAAGDLPAAGQLIAEWDSRAQDDAAYQLLAGAVFERAGNPEALERYTRATSLQPDLELAHLLGARLALLQLGPADAKPIVDLACARLGRGPGVDVLRALEWAVSPATDAAAPSLPDPVALGTLPVVVRGAASAAAAVKAQREGRTDEAVATFGSALGPSATPAMAAWIGYQALQVGHLGLARDAAVQAMQLSAQHQNSQALAARIALAEGRLEEAQKVVRGLDPRSRDAVLIEAASAYENLRGREALSLIDGLSGDAAAAATLLALRESEKVIAGRLRPDADVIAKLASQQQIWGRLVAIDAALDHGRLEAADALMRAPGWDVSRPTHAVRQLRLRRYQGNANAALDLVATSTSAKSSSARSAAEAVLALIDAERVAAAESTFAALGDAAGDLTPWLGAVVEAARGRAPAAAKSLAELPLPTKADPVLVQVVALRALVGAKDRRAKGYLAELSRRLAAHPDVRQVADSRNKR